MPLSDNRRIAKNTLMLYFRQILIMLVSLYTVRVVLETLGAEDYGIYNVVAGVVTMFGFLSGAMASAMQRFFSFAIGEQNKEKLKRLFCINLSIYIGIAIIAVLLLETVGLWFVYRHLNVIPERFKSVLLIYHFSVLTFVSTIVVSPFMAIIIAHEDMQIYAYISILEVILKLVIVFLLVWLPFDKLEVYGVLLFTVSVINASVYIWFCIKKYDECQFTHFYFDVSLLRETVGYTGWTLFGQVSSVVRNQAVTILLNQVFNPGVVAARAIAVSVSSYINVFSNNFNTGLYPPIIKEYSAGNKVRMFSLIFTGSKMTFFLLWIFALPFLLEMDSILAIWLKVYPEDAILFTRLAVIEVLINSISLPIATAARAPGKMKMYELTLGTMQLFIFILSYILLVNGYAAYSVFIIAILINMLMFITRLIIVKRLIGLSVKVFFLEVFFPVMIVITISLVLSLIIFKLLPSEFFFLVLKIILYIFVTVGSMFFIGLDRNQKKKMQSIFLNLKYYFIRNTK